MASPLIVATQPDSIVTYRLPDDASSAFAMAYSAAFSAWENVCGVEFVPWLGDGIPDIDVTFSTLYENGAAEYPHPYSVQYINPNLFPTWGNGVPGSYSWLVIVHEIGHSLGLAHPHEVGVPAADEDFTRSIMSYDREGRPGILLDLPALETRTPMALDIAAAQELYGPTTRHAGNDVWTVTDPYTLQSIVDPGGYDTLNLGQLTGGAVINTQGDFWVRLGDPSVQGAIWIDGEFERVIGTRGNDLILGSSRGEKITGGGGLDTVILDGGDILEGFTKGDQLLADGDFDLHKLSKRELKALGLRGKWIEVEVGGEVDAYVAGKFKLVASLVHEDTFG